METTTKIIERICPNCHETFKIKVYDNLNITSNVEMKSKVLNGSIFDFKCPNCGILFRSIYSIVYKDMEKKYIIFLNMKNKNYDKKIKKIEELYPEYKIRIVSDMMDLIEKIYIFEVKLNDKIITYLGYKIYEDMTRKLLDMKSPIKISKVLFDSFNPSKNQVNFGALNNVKKRIFISATYTDYKTLQNSPKYIQCFKENPGEYEIDQNWAKRI
ncbi:MAG TPA: hypothetical protein GXX63_00480 [Tissierellia bacterium]|nr:hypothetical protein [Tissierellia bacterium]